jgi:hypothetical protein
LDFPSPCSVLVCIASAVRLSGQPGAIGGKYAQLSEARDTRGFSRKHEEIEIPTAIHKCSLILLPLLGEEWHRAMILPGNLANDVKVHDLVDPGCRRTRAVDDRVGFVLQ